MYMHQDMHISPWSLPTWQQLTFFRNVGGVNDLGEELYNPWPYLQLHCHVQPEGNSKILNSRLANTYAQMYYVWIRGDVSIRRNDRTVVENAECVIETVHRWGGHTELEVGAIMPAGDTSPLP
jgi:hypothetical protein